MLYSLRQSGIEFATAVDGTSEWVRPEDVKRFKMEGETLLGKETKVNDAEKSAHKTALSQLEAMREKQEQVSSFESQSAVAKPSGGCCSML